MRLADVVRHLDSIAPPSTAEAWDNVGLLVGDANADVSRAMLCIDYTAAVAEEAEAAGCDLVLAYHPPLFKPLKKLTAGGASALIYDAIRRGVAVYSPHTALDVAEGGTNDVLADVVGIGKDRRPIKLADTKAANCKLVTFVPHDAVAAVSGAMFAAGAGRIGNYSSCSFRSSGTGTFFGEEGTKPAAGQAGRLETSVETRIETVVPLAKVADVVRALKQSHPYETPAFDLVTLAAPPTGAGLGRAGALETPAERSELFDRIKRGLDVDRLLIAGPTEGVATTAAVCAGSCGEYLADVRATKADVYVTGELRHHDALALAAAGMTVVCTLHSHSERVTLRHLAERLGREVAGVSWTVSTRDADPFRIV